MLSAGLWKRRFGADPNLAGPFTRCSIPPLHIVGCFPGLSVSLREYRRLFYPSLESGPHCPAVSRCSSAERLRAFLKPDVSLTQRKLSFGSQRSIQAAQSRHRRRGAIRIVYIEASVVQNVGRGCGSFWSRRSSSS